MVDLSYPCLGLADRDSGLLNLEQAECSTMAWSHAAHVTGDEQQRSHDSVGAGSSMTQEVSTSNGDSSSEAGHSVYVTETRCENSSSDHELVEQTCENSTSVNERLTKSCENSTSVNERLTKSCENSTSINERLTKSCENSTSINERLTKSCENSTSVNERLTKSCENSTSVNERLTKSCENSSNGKAGLGTSFLGSTHDEVDLSDSIEHGQVSMEEVEKRYKNSNTGVSEALPGCVQLDKKIFGDSGLPVGDICDNSWETEDGSSVGGGKKGGGIQCSPSESKCRGLANQEGQTDEDGVKIWKKFSSVETDSKTSEECEVREEDVGSNTECDNDKLCLTRQKSIVHNSERTTDMDLVVESLEPRRVAGTELLGDTKKSINPDLDCGQLQSVGKEVNIELDAEQLESIGKETDTAMEKDSLEVGEDIDADSVTESVQVEDAVMSVKFELEEKYAKCVVLCRKLEDCSDYVAELKRQEKSSKVSVKRRHSGKEVKVLVDTAGKEILSVDGKTAEHPGGDTVSTSSIDHTERVGDNVSATSVDGKMRDCVGDVVSTTSVTLPSKTRIDTSSSQDEVVSFDSFDSESGPEASGRELQGKGLNTRQSEMKGTILDVEECQTDKIISVEEVEQDNTSTRKESDIGKFQIKVTISDEEEQGEIDDREQSDFNCKNLDVTLCKDGETLSEEKKEKGKPGDAAQRDGTNKCSSPEDGKGEKVVLGEKTEPGQPVDLKGKSPDASKCQGDGTVCLQCGLKFSSNQGFSEHLPQHQNGSYRSGGQCALCGLIITSINVLTIHLRSAAARMASAVNRVEKTPSQAVDMKEAPSGKIDGSPVDTVHGSKRSRRAPDKYVCDMASTRRNKRKIEEEEEEVKAYLCELISQGLTVDPQAFIIPQKSANTTVSKKSRVAAKTDVSGVKVIKTINGSGMTITSLAKQNTPPVVNPGSGLGLFSGSPTSQQPRQMSRPNILQSPRSTLQHRVNTFTSPSHCVSFPPVLPASHQFRGQVTPAHTTGTRLGLMEVTKSGQLVAKTCLSDWPYIRDQRIEKLRRRWEGRRENQGCRRLRSVMVKMRKLAPLTSHGVSPGVGKELTASGMKLSAGNKSSCLNYLNIRPASGLIQGPLNRLTNSSPRVTSLLSRFPTRVAAPACRLPTASRLITRAAAPISNQNFWDNGSVKTEQRSSKELSRDNVERMILELAEGQTRVVRPFPAPHQRQQHKLPLVSGGGRVMSGSQGQPARLPLSSKPFSTGEVIVIDDEEDESASARGNNDVVVVSSIASKAKMVVVDLEDDIIVTGQDDGESRRKQSGVTVNTGTGAPEGGVTVNTGTDSAPEGGVKSTDGRKNSVGKDGESMLEEIEGEMDEVKSVGESEDEFREVEEGKEKRREVKDGVIEVADEMEQGRESEVEEVTGREPKQKAKSVAQGTRDGDKIDEELEHGSESKEAADEMEQGRESDIESEHGTEAKKSEGSEPGRVSDDETDDVEDVEMDVNDEIQGWKVCRAELSDEEENESSENESTTSDPRPQTLLEETTPKNSSYLTESHVADTSRSDISDESPSHIETSRDESDSTLRQHSNNLGSGASNACEDSVKDRSVCKNDNIDSEGDAFLEIEKTCREIQENSGHISPQQLM